MNAALADYQQSLLAAFGQVADSLEALDHDQELLASEQAALETSSQSLALTRESYSAGNSGVLQVLDAQRQNQEARLGPGTSAGPALSGHRAAVAGAWRGRARDLGR